MQRTYDVPAGWAGLVAIAAMLVMLALPGTSIASGASQSTRTSSDTTADALQLGAGYAAGGESQRVRALQRRLRTLGWQPGSTDGLFGPRTEAAVARFQRAAGLAADGVVGPATQRALAHAGSGRLTQGAGYGRPEGSARVKRLQQQLRRAGLDPGPVDGRFGPRTEAALARFQDRRGLPATAVVDPRTRRALTTRPDRQAPQRAATGQGQFPRPTAIALTGTEPPEDLLAWLVLTGVMALAFGAVAGLLVGRLRAPSAAPAIALSRGVVAEGKTRWGSAGRFRGHVHALVLGRQGLRGTEEARYLISDPKKSAPFWVDQQEIDRLGRDEIEEDADAERAADAEADEDRGPDREETPEAEVVAAAPVPETVESPEEDPEPPQEEPEPPQEVPEAPAAAVADAETAEDEPEPVQDQATVLGYVSIHRNGEGENRELRRQAQSIDSLCRSRGWRLLEVVRDTHEADTKGRPGLQYAVERLERGEASCLLVSELTRLGDSAADLCRVLESVARTGGRLVAADVGLDTASDAGRIAANSLLRVCSMETERPARRLAATGAGRTRGGPPSVEDVPALKQRILGMRGEGLTLQAIADRLNDEEVPTLRGGQLWRPSSVQAALGYRRPRRERTEEADAM
jgi:peptidoglycan hydrolase-like protein with peptidoglycan-binding domain/DNA invertase Pin-like site-specific DNA recombinase